MQLVHFYRSSTKYKVLKEYRSNRDIQSEGQDHHTTCVWYMSAQYLRQSRSARLQSEDLLDPLLKPGSASPERSNHVFSLSCFGPWPSQVKLPLCSLCLLLDCLCRMDLGSSLVPSILLLLFFFCFLCCHDEASIPSSCPAFSSPYRGVSTANASSYSSPLTFC